MINIHSFIYNYKNIFVLQDVYKYIYINRTNENDLDRMIVIHCIKYVVLNFQLQSSWPYIWLNFIRNKIHTLH